MQAIESLIKAAKQAAALAYCPYSNFAVGAAALCSSGRIYCGSNVENASYGLTLCAERNVLFQAKAAGENTVTHLVIFTPTNTPSTPCGACRQVLIEIAPHASVYAACSSEEIFSSNVKALLPHAFTIQSLRTAAEATIIKSHSDSQRRRRICVDIDNVIAQTDVVMRSVIHEFTSGRVNLTYNDVKAFNYWECSDSSGNSIDCNEWTAIHKKFSSPENLSRIVPVEGVQESLRRLSRLFDIHFATSRLPIARQHTIQWLESHGFPEFDMHFIKHGEKHVSLGIFDFSVEDDLSQSQSFAAAGFGLNFVMAHPWNQEAVNSERVRRVSDWMQIEGALNSPLI